jgi:hypothetical protein
MPLADRDYMRDEGASWIYEPHEFEQPTPARPGLAWTLWQIVVLMFLAVVIVGVLASLLGV